ncbi:small-conductance mechanosensitive channel [Mangrovibacterium marinum]|uniref:Small-conductance mechanosensitive channel n=2 Tax=Mangrovibacterium marinum TaxID=1639118 RepID=A0A2T5C0V0_9BACT|nr:mechanosensitive ion channel domain-containing protein [Mangrovibacterium marinum]PTN08199.1 small-conductance mechanosensitive channel [Mangrovibacterium marinum]
MTNVFKLMESMMTPTVVMLLVVVLLILNRWIFNRMRSAASERSITRGAISFVIVLAGLLAFLLVLPVEKSLKGQLLGFLGIVLSAGIALSSTTVLGNLIAGIMNNSMNRFRNGDLIRIGDLHGRVTKKSIFHTEIQLEDSNFITVPNLYIANNPVKLIRKTNSVLATTVSLGYDLPRAQVEKALKEAALAAGLSDPYVYITGLGDFSVVYKVHGFLDDSGKYFSASSLLNAMVMDKLHEAKIEIVSPAFMYQRRADDKVFVPRQLAADRGEADRSSPEDQVFDEAIKSEKIEAKKDYLREIDRQQEALKEQLKQLKDEREIEKIKSTISMNEALKERLAKSIREQIDRDKETD